MTVQKKVFQFNAEIKALDDNTGKFSGYGSVFGVKDSYNEAVQKGAFTESLQKHGMPALLWQHRPAEVCGVYLDVREDERGLYVEGQLNLETQVGREAYALLKQGALKGLSIGFSTLEERIDRTTGIRHIEKVRLYEVSLVTFPANEAANVETVKKTPASIREFEEFLRDAGYGQSDAKIIAAHGYKGLEAHREGGDLKAVLVGLEGLAQRIKKALPDGGNPEAQRSR